MTTRQLELEAGRLVFYCHTHPGCNICDQIADVWPMNGEGFQTCILNSPCNWKIAADNIMLCDTDALKYYKDLCQYCIMLREASEMKDPCSECIFWDGIGCKIGYPYDNEPLDREWLASGDVEIELEGGEEIEIG